METARDVLVALTHRYAFREVAALVGLDTGGRVHRPSAGGVALDTHAAAQVQQLCSYGQRLLDLDAEDLATADAAPGATTDTSATDQVSGGAVPAHLLRRGSACRMPQAPRDQNRGAMRSLRPVFSLLLEIIEARWWRRETAALLASAHIAAEYAPLLAWETVLGHAGDPQRLAVDEAFSMDGSRFGIHDAAACPHTRPERSAANRALRVSRENAMGWQSYLNRQHSTLAHALGRCAASCRTPCAVMTALTEANRAELDAACRLAQAYGDCALIRMRHAAPVGHGFGVPSPAEVNDAWQHSRVSLGRHGELGATVLGDDDYVLPGLPSLFSAIAGRTIEPDTLLADTAREVVAVLVPG